MRKITLGMFAVLCMSAAAHAGTITTFVEVTTGLMNDGSLANFRTYAMRVTADTDWTNADLEINLTAGSLNHIEGGGFLGGPEPGPQGLGDTAVFQPLTTLGDISGGFDSAGIPAGFTESPTVFKIEWFNTDTDNIGTFDVAMITISTNTAAEGSIKWRTIAGSDVEDGGIGGTFESWLIVGGEILLVPEPSSFLLAGFGVIGILSRRRKLN